MSMSLSPVAMMLGCLVMVLVIMSIGDIVSTLTKAFVPSVFTAALLFLAGFLTGFIPKDVLLQAQLNTAGNMLATVSMYLLITHMGTMMSVRELCEQWKTVVIAIAALAGLAAALWYVGPELTTREAIIVGTPPLSGGIVAAIMMNNAAAEKGLTELALMGTLIYIVQGFVGYPITALCLKCEGKRLLKLRAEGKLSTLSSDAEAESKGFHLVPAHYQTVYTHLACLAVVGLLSQFAHEGLKAVGVNVHALVICLIFGCIAAEFGLVERRALNKANAMGYLMVILMAFIMGTLSMATPDMLRGMVRPMIVIIGVGVTGLLLASVIVGKILGYTAAMSMALSLTALYGFPPNYVLTDEACKALSNRDKDTYDFLMSHMLPVMLTGGFVTVTITSVILAGIYVTLL